VPGARPVRTAETGSSTVALSSSTTGLIDPKLVDVPYSTVNAVARPFGFTVPPLVAAVWVIEPAAPVVVLGGAPETTGGLAAIPRR
jgi:hypothetical protein